MATILDQIVSTKRQEIELAKSRVPLASLRTQVDAAPPLRSFFHALQSDPPSMRLIAEVKKASPSKGILRADFDPVSIARIYEEAGAHCLSVLTDEHYFQGSLEYLRAIRQAVAIPLLRKDFILDPYQLFEARVAGADAVLLIAECLDDCLLRSLHNQAIELGMTPLVEFYAPENLPRVLDAGCQLIGVNNRDLHTFHVDLDHTIRMRELIPRDCLVVGESGIHTRDDVQRLERAGVNAMLVGESLMKSTDIATAVRCLLGTTA